MIYEILQMLILAQTAQEKQYTYYGIIFFGFFLFVLVLDTLGKGKLFPSKGPMKKILIIMCAIVIGVAILLTYIYK